MDTINALRNELNRVERRLAAIEAGPAPVRDLAAEAVAVVRNGDASPPIRTEAEAISQLENELTHVIARHASWLELKHWRAACRTIGEGYLDDRQPEEQAPIEPGSADDGESTPVTHGDLAELLRHITRALQEER